jgi:replication-associated recombination protein RarA
MNLVDKYRPRKLSDILGQSWIVDQLAAFIESPYPCAFLFEGASGTGKTSTALVLAAALGVGVEQDEIGGLWQIASGEQTGETVRRAVDNLKVRPWIGSGWKVLIVNEADAMTPNAAYTWLDVLENIPAQTVVIFTTNNAEKIPGRLRDRCERFVFQSGGLLMRPDFQELVNRVWQAETGRTDAPDVEALGEYTDANGDASFRRVLQRLQPFIRARELPNPIEVVRVKKAVPAPIPGVRFDAAYVANRRSAGDSWGAIAKDLQLPVTTVRGRMKRLFLQSRVE